MHAAEMWLRHGAVERRFVQVDQEEVLDGDCRVQAFKEEDQDGNPDGEPLFVGFDGRGEAKTEATAHRIDALRDLRSYVQGRTF